MAKNMDAGRRGRVVAVCINPKGGFPKQPQTEVVVGEIGFLGDKKYAPERQISVVALEVLRNLNTLRGCNLVPGDLGENITTEGLGDLSDLKPGYILQVGNIFLEVTAQNEPCKKLNFYCKNNSVAKKVYGRRGVVCKVQKNNVPNQKIRPGDVIQVI